MTPLVIGFLSLGGLLVLLAMRVHVGIALGAVSLLGMWAIRGPKAAVAAVADLPYHFVAHWTLSAVPLFLLMGAIVFHTGLTSSLYTAARNWLNFLPGGLAIATNAAGAGFAAVSGSSLATAAAIGRIAIPEMLRAKYDPGLTAAVVAASGTIGSLIPPSILLVIYGTFTEQPIGELLIAGILPGLLTAAVYTVLILTRCVANPKLAPKVQETVSWSEKWASLRETWPVPVLFFAVVVSIYAGIATATEAAAVGAFVALLIAVFQRRLTKKAMFESIMEAVTSTGSIFFVAMGAILLTRLLALSGIPFWMVQQLNASEVDPLVFLLGVSIIYFILGMFLDPIGLMLVTLPVLYPLFEAMDMNLIWVGILVIKYLEIGLLTPPVGLNVYVVKGVAGDRIALGTIFKGVTWFLLAELVVLTLLISFPAISLWLPSLIVK
ncbi:C4-dicarboxylate ABC transporter [Oceanicola sp. 22II-s10i]|uniref:TRAP transporter large permease n=1 Tax=Oceanicola sp. 22II-s10i TaxID=1317116 RepID=UPI000B52460B|nr:TRAP transporter large permease subunit [Oceanicola sp. 22II-s10i]OWU85868.1 C4-dicarboxylate ABC transporter [Oceanicola sp. 22II-s10i]